MRLHPISSIIQLICLSIFDFLRKLRSLLNMTLLRDGRDALLIAYDTKYIDEMEFLLLNEMKHSVNGCPYWNYEKLDLEKWMTLRLGTEFRFLKNDIYRLKEALNIPDIFETHNRLIVDGIEGLCILLKRLAYPNRYFEFIPRFGRPLPQYCIIFYWILDHIYVTFKHLTDFNVAFLTPQKLDEYADAIRTKGAALDNCFWLHRWDCSPCMSSE